MNSYEEDLQYERKMDRISEQIEELMLDATLIALKNKGAQSFLWQRRIQTSE